MLYSRWFPSGSLSFSVGVFIWNLEHKNWLIFSSSSFMDSDPLLLSRILIQRDQSHFVSTAVFLCRFLLIGCFHLELGNLSATTITKKKQLKKFKWKTCAIDLDSWVNVNINNKPATMRFVKTQFGKFVC